MSNMPENHMSRLCANGLMCIQSGTRDGDDKRANKQKEKKYAGIDWTENKSH